MDYRLLVQSTPNPNALKFVVNTPVKTDGSATYKSIDECKENPLAAAIFTVPNVKEVYFYDNYITVTQDGSGDWDYLEDSIRRITLEKIGQHKPDFHVAEPPKKQSVAPASPEIIRIDEI